MYSNGMVTLWQTYFSLKSVFFFGFALCRLFIYLLLQACISCNASPQLQPFTLFHFWIRLNIFEMPIYVNSQNKQIDNVDVPANMEYGLQV